MTPCKQCGVYCNGPNGMCRICDGPAYAEREAREKKERQKADRQRRGVCYSCGKRLTDPLSVKLGIGPECRKGMDLTDAES